MDRSDLLNLYEGGGASAYHPRMIMMFKVVLYAYRMKICTGRILFRFERSVHH